MSSASPTLWVVATPLGNPGDLSPRAREILSSVDFILAEDTRRAGLLCAKAGIRPPRFISFHDHNEEDRLESVIAELKSGRSAALVSDAGTPLCADPGYRLVRACRGEGVRVSPVPGPSAVTAALSASGLPPQPFVFLGFLPRRPGEIEETLEPYAALCATLVFFERRNRLAASLRVAHAVLGERECCVARELTKPHEEFIFFRLGEAPDSLAAILGECTVLVGPPLKAARTPEAQVSALLRAAREGSMKPREAVRVVHGQVRGWKRGELYGLLERDKDAKV